MTYGPRRSPTLSGPAGPASVWHEPFSTAFPGVAALLDSAPFCNPLHGHSHDLGS